MKSKFITGSGIDMQRSDYQRFFQQEPDGFSPERNKYIVEKTIEDYDKKRAERMKEAVEKYEERATAIAAWLGHTMLEHEGAGHDMEKYFGKRMLAHLRGEQIREELMSKLTIMNNQKEIIKPRPQKLIKPFPTGD